MILLRCRFEKQARLKKYAESSNGKADESKKPITISIPVSNEPKTNQTPVTIPVRHTSISSQFHFIYIFYSNNDYLFR